MRKYVLVVSTGLDDVRVAPLTSTVAGRGWTVD